MGKTKTRNNQREYTAKSANLGRPSRVVLDFGKNEIAQTQPTLTLALLAPFLCPLARIENPRKSRDCERARPWLMKTEEEPMRTPNGARRGETISSSRGCWEWERKRDGGVGEKARWRSD
ncbi:hypothetical protein NL676_019152 [Syzygium grande]|nr:hypothetical protein NL676_019152 [Syzygium grande]